MQAQKKDTKSDRSLSNQISELLASNYTVKPELFSFQRVRDSYVGNFDIGYQNQGLEIGRKS